jgi:ABC-type branched-subunit amino acid transport system substrate-binding protein
MGKAVAVMLAIFTLVCASPALAGEFRVGVLLPSSGAKGKTNVVKNAIQLYADQLNAAGGIHGKKVKLVLKEEPDDPNRAREAAQELVRDPELLAVIGHRNAASALGAAKVYDEAKIPCISPNVAAPEVVTANPYMFSINFRDDVEGEFMAVYLKEVLKRDNVLLVHGPDGLGIGLRDAFLKKAEAIGLKVLKVVQVPADVPANWAATKLADKDENAKFGSVVGMTRTDPGVAVLKQVRDLGITVPVMGTSSWTNPKYLELGDKYISDVFVTSALIWEIANEKATKFYEDYRKRFKDPPSIAGALGFDALLLVTESSEALDDAEKNTRPTRQGLRDYLAHLGWESAIDGATGPLFFSKEGDKTEQYIAKFFEDQKRDAAAEEQKKAAPELLARATTEPAANASIEQRKGAAPGAAAKIAVFTEAAAPVKPASAASVKPAASAEAAKPAAPAASVKPVASAEAVKPAASASAAISVTAQPAKEKPVAKGENRAVLRDLFVSQMRDSRYKVAPTQLMVPKEEYVLRELKDRVKKGTVTIIDGQPYHLVDVVFVGVDIVKINDVNPKDMNWDADVFMWFKWSGDRIDPKEIDKIGVMNSVREQSSLLKEDLSRRTKYRAFRKRYTLGTSFDLTKFPFDDQALLMTIGHPTKNSTELMLAADSKHLDDAPIDKINPQEWIFQDRKLFTNLYRYASTFGDPDYRMGKKHKARIYFSTMNIEVDLRRIIKPYLFTFFLPLGIIIGIILLVLWVPVDQFVPRINAAISGVVGILVYHMSQKSSFPKVGYAMIADYYFIAAYALVVTLMIGIIGTQTFQSAGNKELAKSVNRRLAIGSLIAAVAIYAAITLVFGVLWR